MATAVLIPGTKMLKATTPASTKVVVSKVKMAATAGKYASKPIPNPYSNPVLNAALIRPKLTLVHT